MNQGAQWCMGVSSDSGAHHPHRPPEMMPPRYQPRPGGVQTSLTLLPPDPPSSPEAPIFNSGGTGESPTESASSLETWPPKEAFMTKGMENGRAQNDSLAPPPVRRRPCDDDISLRDVARERVDIISEKLDRLSEELREELKNGLRIILDGTGGLQQREEIFVLQKLVQKRTDLTAKTLMRANRTQLEILVAINTGIQAFLNPNISLSQTTLVEVFVYKRCRNIACQNELPADDCACDICTSRNGFCNLCMCVICNKFDFEVNSCRWIGCDLCSHWTHTDCAIRDGNICIGPSAKIGSIPGEMVFRCHACNRTSELLGWVRDVFQHCVPAWDLDALIRELDFVSRIFRGSEDPNGRKLFWKCEDLKEKMKSGVVDDSSTARRTILMFFQELELDSPRNAENGDGGRLIAPQEACNRIAEVVHEAVRKMEMVAEEKMRRYKKARMDVEAFDRELEDKSREAEEIKLEKQRKKVQIEELEKMVMLKQAESDMFQLKANEAKREAERLQRIAMAKWDESEEDFASNYLKQRLSEAEAEKQYLFEKVKLEESFRASKAGGPDDHS